MSTTLLQTIDELIERELLNIKTCNDVIKYEEKIPGLTGNLKAQRGHLTKYLRRLDDLKILRGKVSLYGGPG